jgi:ClpP class serine protease
VSKLDLEKSKEDVEGILVQFSDFVGKNRPSLVMDEVATGETWFGNAALEKGLCDEIKTVDDVLLNYVDLGYNVYEIDYSPPQAVPSGLAGLLPFSESSDDNSIGRRAIRWLVGTVASEVRSVIGSDSADKKYLVQDDTADRVQMRD